MGSDLFWFLDLFVLGITLVTVYRGAKRGAVAVLIGAVAAIAAFVLASLLCGPISGTIYDSLVRNKVEEYTAQRLGSAFDAEVIHGLSDVDMMKTKVNGTYLSDMVIEYDERGTAIIDLSSADMTETGIDRADLSGFGIKSDRDWTAVKAGHINITQSDVRRYGIGNVILARFIASNLTSGEVFRAFADIGNKLGETASPSLKSLGSDLSDGSRDAVYSFVVSIVTVGSGTLGERVMDDVITPTVMVPLRAVVFCLIFALVMLILGIIANASKVINRIPIVSEVNGVLGAVLGILEAAVVILLICIIMRLLISICGGQLVFINDATIERTFVFKYLYRIDVLKLLNL
ncbi:MAG: CvpA family protein [Ruminiclostridium sp.]|nr:CvpA family protein [Ruminiclostridium sp.]